MTANAKVGEFRPSQLLIAYGVGAIIDLPKISVIVTGLEDWPVDPDYMREVHEERLLRAFQAEHPGVAWLMASRAPPDGNRAASPLMMRLWSACRWPHCRVGWSARRVGARRR